MGSLVVLLLAERARSEGARSMRAVKDGLPAPYEGAVESQEPCSTAGVKAPHSLA
jgi:hypothetical protein